MEQASLLPNTAARVRVFRERLGIADEIALDLDWPRPL